MHQAIVELTADENWDVNGNAEGIDLYSRRDEIRAAFEADARNNPGRFQEAFLHLDAVVLIDTQTLRVLIAHKLSRC